ncbi:MAG: VacJ family lipoprotein [Halioglobus sp.]
MRKQLAYTPARIFLVLAIIIMVSACNTAPPMPEPQPELSADEIEEPVFSARRILNDDVADYTADYDPWEGMNRRVYNFNYHFDHYVFLPVVHGWQAVVPSVARHGIHNFFNNFRDMRTIVNSILQLSPKKTIQATGRVLVNSTLGLLGFVDVASDAGMPRPIEDFGQTLGHWGVESGPYLVLPILGPSNVRDGIGLIPDTLVLTAVQKEVLTKPLRKTIFAFDAVDTRAFLPFRYYETGSAFEYETLRWMYGVKRELDIAK